MNNAEKIQYLSQLINSMDAVVIGGGSGLSSSAGYDHYHWSSFFSERLGSFREHYGFTSPFAGFYHCFSKPEEKWAYYSAYAHAMQTAPAGKVYSDLKRIIDQKPYFIITTNVDGQFERVFDEKYICDFQGNFGYFQCSQPCHDYVYKNDKAVEEMYNSISDFRIKTELIPRCPECGRQMVMWVRDDTFLEGEKWDKSTKHYYDFLEKWLIHNNGSKVMLLELGVGEMTPSIIELPFWNIAENNENVTLVRINKSES